MCKGGKKKLCSGAGWFVGTFLVPRCVVFPFGLCRPVVNSGTGAPPVSKQSHNWDDAAAGQRIRGKM